MKKITIAVVFKQSGRAYINVLPSNYPLWHPVISSEQSYLLGSFDYTITYDTITQDGGKIIITDDATGTVLASADLAAGHDHGSFDITI